MYYYVLHVLANERYTIMCILNIVMYTYSSSSTIISDFNFSRLLCYFQYLLFFYVDIKHAYSFTLMSIYCSALLKRLGLHLNWRGGKRSIDDFFQHTNSKQACAALFFRVSLTTIHCAYLVQCLCDRSKILN